MRTKGKSLKKMNNHCLSKWPSLCFSRAKHLPAVGFWCVSTSVGHTTYLVNVLQFVNDLTNHRLRPLQFQLMEVKLILHPVPGRLLAVSVERKGKRTLVKENPTQREH